MKKILLIIFLFFCCTNVYAEEKRFSATEVIPNISYLKYDGETYFYRNAHIIREVSSNEIAYCVEPFVLLVNNTKYSSDSNFNSKYRISEENWNKAKLIAYYGYGYKNHTDKKWISITQLTIWRTIFPQFKYDWIDNTTSRKVIYPYNSEINELNTLVNNHYTLPKLEDSYDFGINEEIELKDDNKVLNNYKIIKSDFDSQLTANNSLIIKTPNEEKEGSIIFERASANYNQNTLFYYNSSSQNVMERGNITPIKFEIKIRVSKGKIIVRKVDEETFESVPQGEASLDGAVFELYDGEMNFLKELVVKDGFVEFDDLKFGKYYLREIDPGRGYYLNDRTYETDIDEYNLEPEIIIGNQVIKSRVTIHKYYGTKKEVSENRAKPESNVEFEIYNSSDELVFSGVTNEDGIIELDLPYGSYVLKQKSTTNGYELIDDYHFIINEDCSISLDIPLYDLKIEVPNASISIFELIFEWWRFLYV